MGLSIQLKGEPCFMMISTKGRYALKVMIDLAEHQSSGYIPLQTIADRQQISEKYLETILRSMVQHGLLVGVRGKGGGYRLTRSPSEYSVGEILRLSEENLAPVACLEHNAPECQQSADCRTLPIWIKLNDMINKYLDSVSLADLLPSLEPGNDYVI